MDRLNRTLAGCGLAFLMVAGSGCRSTPSSVPPGHAYGTNESKGGFGSEPHPMTSAAPPAAMSPYGANSPGGAAAQFGTPPPGGATGFGGPTGPMYGPPGSSPLGQAPAQPPGMALPAPAIGGTAAPSTNVPGSPGSFPPPQ
jgi:hypothetical protein